VLNEKLIYQFLKIVVVHKSNSELLFIKSPDKSI
jgi:hypothetical protein